MVTIIIFILVLSLLVFVHEFGHFIVAKKSGILVEEFGIGMGPRIFTVGNDGETLYTINLLPIGGFVRLQGEVEEAPTDKPIDETRSFNTKKPIVKAAVLTAGITMNFLLGMVLIGIILAVNGKPNVTIFFEINNVAESSPAAEEKLISGNLIVAYKTINDNNLTQTFTQDDFIKFISENKGSEVVLEIAENNDEDSPHSFIKLIPRVNPPEGQGALGIQFTQNYSVTYQKLPWYYIPGESIKTSYTLTLEIAKGFSSMISDLIVKREVPADIAGPIGVAKLTGDAAAAGIIPLMQLVALISINLAFVNILPFPALDGGRLVFVVIEGIFKRKVLPKYEGWIHLAGFVILLALIVVISFSDIKKFF